MASLHVNAWVGSSNLGDELVFRALRAKLTALGVGTSVTSIDPASTRRDHDVESVGHDDAPGLWRATGRADGVLLGGGGLLQDETSPWNLPYHLSRGWLAGVHHRPMAGVGLGASSMSSSLGRTLVQRSLRGAVAVSVRDADSADVLTSLGLPRPLVAADLALSLPVPGVEAEAEVADRMAVCLRPWRGAASRLPVALRRPGPATPTWFVEATAAALDRCARRSGLATHFVAFQGDRDHEIHQAVAARMTTDVSFAVPTLDDVIDEVARCRLVVAMRYHGGIAAVLAGRPVALIGYSPKVASLAAEIGPGAAALGWDAPSLDRLPEAVATITGQDDVVIDARGRLREREGLNDRVLERLLGAG